MNGYALVVTDAARSSMDPIFKGPAGPSLRHTIRALITEDPLNPDFKLAGPFAPIFRIASIPVGVYYVVEPKLRKITILLATDREEAVQERVEKLLRICKSEPMRSFLRENFPDPFALPQLSTGSPSVRN